MPDNERLFTPTPIFEASTLKIELQKEWVAGYMQIVEAVFKAVEESSREETPSEVLAELTKQMITEYEAKQ